MPTPIEITNAVEDKVLDSVRVGQKAVVDTVRSWAETVETVFSRLPELGSVDTPLKPTQAFENAFGFAERLWATQREFAAQVLEAAVPATRAAASATAQASQASRNVTAQASQASRNVTSKP
jgi:hypothetical protein